MIKFTIEIPNTVAWVQTPKMILGNYIESDDRVRRIECDRMMGYCTTVVKVEEDLNRQLTYYTVCATYTDPEAEMITRLLL